MSKRGTSKKLILFQGVHGFAIQNSVICIQNMFVNQVFATLNAVILEKYYINIISASLNATWNAVILKINLLQFRTHLYWRKNYSNAVLLKRRYNFCDSDCSYAGEKFMLQKTRAQLCTTAELACIASYSLPINI